MAEIEQFTWDQIGHFWAQLQIMSLSGRRSDMQLEKLCSADFRSILHTASLFRPFSAEKRSDFAV